MDTKTGALKISGLKTGGKRIKKHGIVKNGKVEEAKFLAENPTCFYCGDPSKFPITKLRTTDGKPIL